MNAKHHLHRLAQVERLNPEDAALIRKHFGTYAKAAEFFGAEASGFAKILRGVKKTRMSTVRFISLVARLLRDDPDEKDIAA